jgi:hypothetical protein
MAPKAAVGLVAPTVPRSGRHRKSVCERQYHYAMRPMQPDFYVSCPTFVPALPGASGVGPTLHVETLSWTTECRFIPGALRAGSEARACRRKSGKANAHHAIPIRACRTMNSRRSRMTSRSVLTRSICPRAIMGFQATPGQSSQTIRWPTIRRPDTLSLVPN